MTSFARCCPARLVSFIAAAIAFALAAPAVAQVKPHAGMLRYPDVNATHIVLVYANDLWLAPRDGGLATPLASPPGGEAFPKFSPDGKTIAFQGNYDGGRDIYTLAADGSGLAQRVTHHPSGERLCEWTADGQLVFAAGDVLGLGQMAKLYTVARDGGMPIALPVPYGTSAAISDDGTWLAYTPHTADTRTWKRYRGGMATDIWLFNLKDNTAKRMTDWEGTDTLPMWPPGGGSKVYYLSDAGPEHRLNIWEYDTGKNGGARKQVTEFKDFDVKWPSIGPGKNNEGEIGCQCGSALSLLDLSNNQSKTVEITIPGERPTLRERPVDVARSLGGWGISPTGKRASAEARGDIWTTPAENGTPRNLTSTSGFAERYPAWSPDGQWISYFSDASGEYELYITQSDGKGETKQLTEDGNCWRYNVGWSPDSKRILFTDKTGGIYLHTIDTGETKLIDRDEWAGQPDVSWSHDSRWLAYDKTIDRGRGAIFICNVETGEVKQDTNGVFSDSTPAFDRKGDWLYYQSARNFAPVYSDIPGDTTFIYQNTGVLLAVPLRLDVEYPWPAKSDEEMWGDDKKKEAESQPADSQPDKNGDEANDANDEDKKNGNGNGGGNGGGAKDDQPPAKDDGVSGTWEGTAQTADGPTAFTLTVVMTADHAVTGAVDSPAFSFSVAGTFDPASSTLTLSGQVPDGPAVTMTLKIDGESMTGTGEADGQAAPITARRTAKAQAGKADDGNGKGDAKKDDKERDKETKRQKVDIEFEGFEARAIQLPIPAGQFGDMAVNDGNALIYARRGTGGGGGGGGGAGGSGGGGIFLFDLKDEKKEEKSVVTGAANFDISADGKKLLVVRGNAASIQNATAGGSGSAKNVITDGCDTEVNPREEWKQVLTDTWRLYRDFFYVANLHGVDWNAVHDHYAQMLPDCATRDDLSYIIAEMISELNVGHAYYRSGDTGENVPNVGAGLLGCDFTIENGAYRISEIYSGAPWDSDARGPLSQPGINVKEGDYLLAINGKPLDINVDPWEPLVGKAGEVVEITVSDKPTLDDPASPPAPPSPPRHILINPIGSDENLRYRAWIEKNRKYVEDKSAGQVGYIYVPDTGRGGQNDLFRQFFGQMDKDALIIDERWNGGGQIPTRFIELLNRPRTNYWARRDGKDWMWPPDSNQGPKCMLINGLAGSGGDMFPWLFQHNKLGPLIGTRTWGGLVGISGNPPLIDGGSVTVPTFGFYETDGTWGIEGHGTDPDIEVIDDPSKMLNGADPQLDRAIEEMLKAIAKNPPQDPKRPADPDRKGMGVREEDK